MIDTILFPSSYFNIKQVDEDLKKEYNAAKDTGLYNGIIIFSYEDWFHNDKIVLNTYPENKITGLNIIINNIVIISNILYLFLYKLYARYNNKLCTLELIG